MDTKEDFWSNFTLKIHIKKDINAVYNCWATADGLSSWFLESASRKDKEGHSKSRENEFQVGDTSTWKWHNWDILQETTILTANSRDIVEFTFGSGGNIKVSLTEKNDGTEVELVQYDIPTDEQGQRNFHLGCTKGWTFWLTNLKAYLEYGILLNDIGLTQSEATNRVNS